MSGQTQERVGFEAWLGIKPCGAAHDLAYEAFKAGAAWQRTQAAGVPDCNQLSNFIRSVNGNNRMGAGALAEQICEWLAAAPTVKAERVQCEVHGDDSSACEKYSGNVPCEPAPAQPAERQEQGEVHSAAARDVLAESKRQITAEDFDASHDDMATRGQIAMAAGLYAIDAAHLAAGRISLSHPSSLWPWPEEWWKPAGSRRNLVKAGALILAEIERLDRAALAARTGQEVGK